MARGVIRTSGGSTSRSTSGHPIHTGTIEDLQTRTVYAFEQPLFEELGLDVGVKASYNLVKDSTNRDIAVGLEPIERGVIVSINGDTGRLRERASGAEIDFTHSRSRESNIVVGSVVRYEKVDYNGVDVATSLTLIR